jgi:hypothetical protein
MDLTLDPQESQCEEQEGSRGDPGARARHHVGPGQAAWGAMVMREGGRRQDMRRTGGLKHVHPDGVRLRVTRAARVVTTV